MLSLAGIPAGFPSASAPSSASVPASANAIACTTTAELRERLAQLERAGGASPRSGRRGNGHGGTAVPCALPSGHAALDASLPGGGWPLGALTELLSDAAGIGELQLLMPALTELARADRCIAWVAPPYLPYAPALAQLGLPPGRLLTIRTTRPQESLWAAEQALRCPAVGAVLSWAVHIVDRNLRRLQLAAESGGTLGILHRPALAADAPSPAALRLRLRAATDGLVLEVKKARGGRAGARLQLSRTSLEGRDAVAVHTFTGAGA